MFDCVQSNSLASLQKQPTVALCLNLFSEVILSMTRGKGTTSKTSFNQKGLFFFFFFSLVYVKSSIVCV